MPQPDHLRCSDADRTAIEQLLTDAYSDGRLTREEHDERLNKTWEAKTFGDLREITTDLVPTDPKPASYLVGSPRATGRARWSILRGRDREVRTSSRSSGTRNGARAGGCAPTPT
ncbi:MAG: DUF1707 domain-containing protein [Arachnia propionica]